jgi:hypothetical protein
MKIKIFVVKKIHADNNVLNMTTKVSELSVAPQIRRQERKNC